MKKMILMTALAGAFGYSILPSFGLRHCQSLRRRKNNEGRILYLTFDDGPSEAYTEALLDLLDEYDIKASFFVVAEFAQKNPRIILRAKKEGHLIGIHSVNHQNALFWGNRFAFSDLAASIMTLKKLGCDAGYYRPPWGHLNLFILYWVKKMNLKLYFGMLWLRTGQRTLRRHPSARNCFDAFTREPSSACMMEEAPRERQEGP